MFTKDKRYLDKWNMVSHHLEPKQWSDIDPAQGTFAVLVDDTWRIGSTRSTFECLVYLLPAKVQPLKEINNALSEYPTPVHINVARKVSFNCHDLTKSHRIII
ncbi:hypothetical protein RO3G_06620 [Rhizopus delemar RA 99-880]|uniref:Uncharacterized protein n=1 Tax=Rhizopus delemar (strain RA 99-880 / ATCC MYA-4621 / FGSC 9543 / NRRL 43880) TaxID=246409 RepID=I1C0D5_RHIO9|nr:hypothetical protein RO3G_06620 [Rhizopus delemar RA 99-880]|eukprot:EIE81915.1 hypothetical protein RO3G_06620 [Rhizopus delemar RA 99-880]